MSRTKSLSSRRRSADSSAGSSGRKTTTQNSRILRLRRSEGRDQENYSCFPTLRAKRSGWGTLGSCLPTQANTGLEWGTLQESGIESPGARRHLGQIASIECQEVYCGESTISVVSSVRVGVIGPCAPEISASMVMPFKRLTLTNISCIPLGKNRRVLQH
jgi:hypothetical protein